MPDETRVWPHAACKAGNLAPASAIMILPFKVCEAPGSWRWEAPHPGNRLCLQAPGLRVTRPERTSAAMSAARRPRHGAGAVRVRVHHAWPVKHRAASSATQTMRQRSLTEPRPSRMCRTAVSRQFRPASCRSHVAAQARNQARGGSRQAALQGTSNRSGTAGQSARHRAAIVAPADGRHAEQAASMATDAARFAQKPASRRESTPDGIRSAEVPGARRVQDAKIAFAIVQLAKRGI